MDRLIRRLREAVAFDAVQLQLERIDVNGRALGFARVAPGRRAGRFGLPAGGGAGRRVVQPGCVSTT